MDAEVDQRTATSGFLGREPGAEAGDAGAAHPVRLAVVDTSERAGGDLVAHDLDIVTCTALKGDCKDAVVFFGGLDHLAALGGVAGEGLLDQDVLAGIEGGDGDGPVEDVWDGDAHCLNVVLGEQVLVVSVHARDVEPPGEHFAAVGIEAGQGDDLDAGVGGVAFEVKDAGAAPNHANANLICGHQCSSMNIELRADCSPVGTAAGRRLFPGEHGTSKPPRASTFEVRFHVGFRGRGQSIRRRRVSSGEQLKRTGGR